MNQADTTPRYAITLRSLWRPSTVVLLIILLLATIVMFSHDQGVEVFHDTGPGWYDGVFFYQLAISPTNAASHLDNPAYRYQRILYPLLARTIGLGHPQGISFALFLVNLVALSLGTELLGQILEAWSASRWYALIYAFFIGQWVAIRFDTSEPLCYLLVLAGILALERKHLWPAALLFSLAMLTKDLALYFIAAYGLAYLVQRRWREALVTGLAVVPYVVLQLGLWFWLGEFALTTGPGPAFASFPFFGYLQRELDTAMVFLPLILLLPAIIGVMVGLYYTAQKWPDIDPIPVALLLNALLVILLPSETTGEIRAAGRIATGLVLAMVLTGAHLQASRILNYSILWIPLSMIYLPSLLFGI